MDNVVIGNIELVNSLINWGGHNNIIYIPDGHKVVLRNSNIRFLGNNSLVFLNTNNVCLNINIFNNNTFYLGENASINKGFNVNLSEEKSVFIGNDLLSSFDIWIRTADPHLIYDSNTKTRINPSKSVFIGDHVWLGQESFIFKGSIIGSGSIIGAKALTTNKVYKSNASFGGITAKLLKDNVFFLKTCVHDFTSTETLRFEKLENDKFVFSGISQIETIKNIINFLDNNKSIDEKIKFLNNLPLDKNRFYI